MLVGSNKKKFKMHEIELDCCSAIKMYDKFVEKIRESSLNLKFLRNKNHGGDFLNLFIV